MQGKNDMSTNAAVREELRKKFQQLQQTYADINDYKKQVLACSQVDIVFLTDCVHNAVSFIKKHDYQFTPPQLKKANIKSCIKAVKFFKKILKQLESDANKIWKDIQDNDCKDN